ncbi:putative twitching motility protein [Anaplasma phagocytophilum str. CRT53-1]|uniref:Putative twitching motility protein n=1 Tax=Anaplasma phagocytophilum str. CRT53-1 TaxID=1359157 RepID=A0A0F3PUX8_ANAPH|nr:putative twitching motility protein [Anaplasma phagocytophilum str. CRT53-1]
MEILGYFKQLVASSIQREATRLYCMVGHPPAIKRLNRLEFLQVRKNSAQDIEDMVGEILTEESRIALDTHGEVQVSLEFDALHSLHIFITKTQHSTEIIGIIKKLHLPTREDLPKELIQVVSSATYGIILLGGSHCCNKDLTIQCLINTVSEAHKRLILTFGMPNTHNEHLENAIVSSYPLSQANMELIRRYEADIVLFSKITPDIMKLAHECVMQGILVIVQVDASSPAHTVTRALSMFPDRKSGINFLADNLLGIAFQVLVSLKLSSDSLYLCDFIMNNDEIKQCIMDDKVATIESKKIVEMINKLIEDEKLTHYDAHPIFVNLMNSFGKAIEATDVF